MVRQVLFVEDELVVINRIVLIFLFILSKIDYRHLLRGPNSILFFTDKVVGETCPLSSFCLAALAL